jgi:hypothetical protein
MAPYFSGPLGWLSAFSAADAVMVTSEEDRGSPSRNRPPVTRQKDIVCDTATNAFAAMQ